MKIIITGGKASKSLKLLKAFTQAEVVLADYGEMPAFGTAAYTFLSLGERNDEVIAHNLLNICLDQQADTLLPLYEFEVYAVSRAATLFKEYNITVLLPELPLLEEYFNKPIPQPRDWAIFNQGEVIFSTLPWVPSYPEKMTGVFYIKEVNDEIFTSLFTIA